ncbi:bifunctional isochorismate lyase/aryl carrier protein [Nocardia transvalensis]|uniref:Bifunctional isochorismate lyase/aryl carrier protein n=1 Tax=Nocardia transvalensis TaxID=37333 RepID=A0A7W9P9T9_9NOCA|nr:isochorismatase family protein [Nocardia transvalensis]MBB5912157.1 bifunctional isochorismate lyase/aryl carrier protein [Nocardia transvalensis]
MFGGIPDVISYDIPSPDELPENIVDWTVDSRRSALLIHDMQNYFLRPLRAGGSPYAELVTNIGLLRAACRHAGVPVAYTAQPGGMTRTERGLLRDVWGDGMTTDETDRAVLTELTPGPGDRVFTKWRYSAFHASGLLEHLRELGRDQLIVCGVYAHVGVLVTACESYSHDIETFLAADAVADFTAEDHRMTLAYAAARCAMVRTTADLVAGVQAGDAASRVGV